jgi:hypothetical protein
MTAQKIHVRGQLFYTIMRRGEEREKERKKELVLCTLLNERRKKVGRKKLKN